jgi:phenylacetate-CoA ligase
VLTTLTTNAYPLLRYRTSDITTLHLEPCSCGRTLARMDRVLKRADKMIPIRGINVFPEKIQEVLAAFPGLGPGYRTLVSNKRGMNDQMRMEIEASPAIMSGGESRREALRDALHLALRRTIALRVEVELKSK